MYNIKVLKQLFCTDICSVLLIAHAFSGSDTTSRIFGVGKKSVFHKVVIGDPVMHACANTFCSPESDKDDIETNGCKAMVSLFGGSQTDSLESSDCKFLSKKVVAAKSFAKPERLPPTTSAAKFDAKRSCSGLGRVTK